ncbi:hypothetical protein LINGRAHAP2_LOCUS22024, partial [Linum grandiflorum]
SFKWQNLFRISNYSFKRFVSPDRGEVGAGVCIRDEQGNLCMYRTMRKRDRDCSKENEAIDVCGSENRPCHHRSRCTCCCECN